MDTNMRNFFKEFRYSTADPVRDRHREDYVPLSERDPSEWQDKVEVLPSYGFRAQEGKEMAQMQWCRTAEKRPRTTRSGNWS